MAGAAYWLTALLLQAPAAEAAPVGTPDAALLREAGQVAIRQWIGCVVAGAKARTATGAAAAAAVAEAKPGCLAERAATGAAIAAAERAAGNPVTDDQVEALVAGLDATIAAGAAVIVGKETKRRR